jgi:putative SOS response-associated peptidase YedK
MCGRFSNRYTWRELHALYQLSVGFQPPSNFQPRYNIAPTDMTWIVRERDGARELVSLRWGLVPSWAKDIKIGASMINARAETAAQKFKAAFEARPCLVVADGFYEWKAASSSEAVGQRKKSGKEKQPYFVTLKGGAPFAFGGLWERWRPREGDAVETFTIITTPPNDLAAQVHDRMPLVLAPEMWNGWLSSPDDRAALMKPFPAERMEMWPVDKRVGNVANDDADLVKPVAEIPPKQGKLL